MLLEGGLVQFGTGEQSWYDEVSQEIIGQLYNRFSDFSQTQASLGALLVHHEVDGVVLLHFQQPLQEVPPHIVFIISLDLPQNQVEG